ncbi:hypothetical protein OE88DRAFT_1661621 [Heliocybe sulcata]|uniref:Uncharacterized protein n=1 Tax=Heliocybe sulcata TaxID=5364 RepID=A0A5C3MXQ5_9AGAM|nr:hypothetical protein OE88DRAFT_1661621 [Heliocybe sulcata]
MYAINVYGLHSRLFLQGIMGSFPPRLLGALSTIAFYLNRLLLSPRVVSYWRGPLYLNTVLTVYIFLY